MCAFVFSIASGKKYAVQVDPVVGELLRPIILSESEFIALQSKCWNCSTNGTYVLEGRQAEV